MCHLGLEALDDAPFLTTKNGITMVDLALVPEKYRLLVPRTEDILNRCLTAWLEKVEKALENREQIADSEPVLS